MDGFPCQSIVESAPASKSLSRYSCSFPFRFFLYLVWFNIMHMADDQVYSIIRSLSNEILSIRDLEHEVILNGKLRIGFMYLQCNAALNHSHNDTKVAK